MFALDAGLAFGAFHRHVYKPFKSKKLGGGLVHNRKAKLKADLAAAFAYNRVKAALRSRILSKVLAPLLAPQTKLGSMRSVLKLGHTAQVEAANSNVSSAGSASGAAGQPIQDQPTPSFGG